MPPQERPSTQEVNNEALRKKVFFDLEKSYFVKENQEKGERWLAEIATIASTEYIWAYDQETGTWHHLIAEKDNLIDTKKGRLRHKLTLPKSFETPPSANSVHYHIHPAAPFQQVLSDPDFDKKEYTLDVFKVRSQLPSVAPAQQSATTEGDIQTAIRLFKNGYKGFKIVTPIGITTIEYDEVMARQVEFLGSLTLKFEDLLNAIKKGGVVGGIEDQLRRWNEYNRGVYTISFEPFNTSPEIGQA